MLPQESKFRILMKYFMDNFSLELRTSQRPARDWFEKRAKYYFEQLIEFNSAIEKVEKYALYFKSFYPKSDEITEEEAMEHHWHSYMQDIYIVKVRGVAVIGSMKNDLPRYPIGNPELAVLLLDHLKKNLERGLKSASDFRGGHTHQKTVRHPELVKVRALKTIKEYGQGMKIDMTIVDSKILESLQKSKEEYVQMAEKNAISMQEFREFFSPRFGHLFASINGHDISIFKMD